MEVLAGGQLLGQAYSHVGVDMHSIWRDHRIPFGIKEKIVDAVVRLIELRDARDGVT